ncbi:MAG: sensor domain-containing diguanylate cyclase [Proteobacteria bacterium]|nr:sensor domain-containing diguanylate cyclase [Pseudomonadota bacterium]
MKLILNSLARRSENRRTGPGEQSKLDQLQARLDRLEDRIQENEHVWAGFRFIEVSLIGTRDLAELFAVLRDTVSEAFDGIDAISVTCFDDDYQMLRVLERNGTLDNPRCIFRHIAPQALEGLFSSFSQPILGACTREIQGHLFPDYKGKLGSVAVAPLILQNKLIGSFNQASSEADHFTSEAGTDLLEHLSAVLAICIDNTLAHEKLKEDGLTDPLTGLSNRRFFERRLREEVDRWQRHGKPLSCFLIDLDFFKKINDQYGHQAGDVVLKSIANELGAELRASDVIARYGGEEFVMLLPDTDMDEASDIAARLRCRIGALDWSDSVPELESVTASIGIAQLQQEEGRKIDEAGEQLLKMADDALYKAKEDGRNCVVCAPVADNTGDKY